MIQPGKNLAFVLEAGKNVARVLSGAHELEGDLLLVLIVSPNGTIDFSHSAGPDLLDDSVGTDAPSDPIGFVCWKQRSGGYGKVRAVKKFIADPPFLCH
jgi:hypothetical protein